MLKSDKIKLALALAFFVAAILFSLGGLVVGSIQWDVPTGVAVMIVVFLALFTIAGLFLFTLEDLSWLTVSLPYLVGVLYSVFPDFIPLSLDDAAATTAGAIFTFILALRKDPRTPKWVFLPLAAAGIYTFFGGLLPGPIDELLVDGIAFFLAAYGATRPTPEETP